MYSVGSDDSLLVCLFLWGFCCCFLNGYICGVQYGYVWISTWLLSISVVRQEEHRGLKASSFDEIWHLKWHTGRSPNSLCNDSWAKLHVFSYMYVTVWSLQELKFGLKLQRKWYRKLKSREQGLFHDWSRFHRGMNRYAREMEDEIKSKEMKCILLHPLVADECYLVGG